MTCAQQLVALRAALPDAIVVGDSTGPVYAGNFLTSMPTPGPRRSDHQHVCRVRKMQRCAGDKSARGPFDQGRQK